MGTDCTVMLPLSLARLHAEGQLCFSITVEIGEAMKRVPLAQTAYHAQEPQADGTSRRNIRCPAHALSSPATQQPPPAAACSAAAPAAPAMRPAGSPQLPARERTPGAGPAPSTPPASRPLLV